MPLKEEIFKQLVDYPNYEIGCFGTLKSMRTGKILKHFTNPDGYVLYKLYKNSKPKTVKVHRLVGEYFIPNPENKPQINHKDGIKHHNECENLEWSTKLENQIHAYNTGLQKKEHERDLCLQISLDGFLIGVFKSRLNASEQTGIGRKRIEKSIARKKSYGGYIWA